MKDLYIQFVLRYHTQEKTTWLSVVVAVAALCGAVVVALGVVAVALAVCGSATGCK